MSIETELGDRIGHPPEDPEATEHSGNGHEDDRSALLGHLRQIHTESKQKDYKLDLEVPGMKGLMMLRFRPYNTAKSERKADALKKRMDAGEPIMLDAACDTLADSCSDVLVRKSKDLDWAPLDDEDPIALDVRLGELLGFANATTPRKVVKELFPTEQTITAMAIRVNNWLTGAEQEADEEFLGE